METKKNDSTETPQKNILVTGDFVIDHHLLKGNKSNASDQEKSGATLLGTILLETKGGARLTHDLLNKFAEKENSKFFINWAFESLPERVISHGTDRDSYIRWNITLNEKGKENEQICTLKEKLGFGEIKVDKKEDWLNVKDTIKNEKFDVILIDEAGIGFRDYKNAWPDFSMNLKDSKDSKIILKTTNPLCDGLLWNELLKFRKNLTVITNLNHLIHYNIKVSNNISWEQTALDIVYGINKNGTLKNLLKAAEIIITIGSAGAVYIKTNDNPELNEYTLVFDPENMDNEWENKNKEDIKNSIGLGSSFVAGFVASGKKDTVNNIKVGLNAMNSSMINGIFNFENNLLVVNDLSNALTVRFKDRYYSSAFIPSPAWISGLEYLNNSEWTILENNYENYKKDYKQKHDLFTLAYDLAENGISTLHYAPRLSLDKVTVIDRNEIENLRNIRAQIDFYDKNNDGKNPLNIAVFGAPGAGKSFIVKELASSVFKGKEKEKLESMTFNLSQFKEESELSGPFHAIRDSVLRGKLPIVFWDEFDSEDYKWLRCMIGPMQDGVFQAGKDTHPIGKCVFIFAGGTTYSMQHFADKMDVGYITKKGPDFVSRIVCSLNVFGLNKKPYEDLTEKSENKWKPDGDKKDICFSVRRALFIRTMLNAKNKKLEIDANLLRTLIEIDTYKCGSRGLERILRNLAVYNNRKIELSDLPSKEIIRMNVKNYDRFVEMLNEDSNIKDVSLEKMAPLIHNSWIDHNATHSVYYKNYEDLSYDGRLDNIEAAKRIEKVIEKSGKFKLVSKEELKSKQLLDASSEFEDFIKDNDNLDQLAEEEHNGWMETRKAAKWILGERSDYHKIHDCLIPFNELDKGIDIRKQQKQKEKDRDSIQKYTKILKDSEFVITKK